MKFEFTYIGRNGERITLDDPGRTGSIRVYVRQQTPLSAEISLTIESETAGMLYSGYVTLTDVSAGERSTGPTGPGKVG